MNKGLNKDIVKSELGKKLIEHNALWSYRNQSLDNIPDEELIEKVLIYLDLNSIALLFNLYPRKTIKKIWKERMVIGGDYLANLNTMIAMYYFGIKKPEQYIKRIESQHINQILKNA